MFNHKRNEQTRWGLDIVLFSYQSSPKSFQKKIWIVYFETKSLTHCPSESCIARIRSGSRVQMTCDVQKGATLHSAKGYKAMLAMA